MTEKTNAPHPDPDAARLKAEAAQLIRQGRTQEAAGVLDRAAALRPGDAELSLLLGSALYHLGDYAASLEKLTRAAALEPQRHDAHLLLARSAIKAGDAMSQDDVSALLDERERVERSGRCPHGRPTAIRLTVEELAWRGRFPHRGLLAAASKARPLRSRPWVPCSSASLSPACSWRSR